MLAKYLDNVDCSFFAEGIPFRAKGEKSTEEIRVCTIDFFGKSMRRAFRKHKKKKKKKIGKLARQMLAKK